MHLKTLILKILRIFQEYQTIKIFRNAFEMCLRTLTLKLLFHIFLEIKNFQ